jgi:uncharacterized membrane protein
VAVRGIETTTVNWNRVLRLVTIAFAVIGLIDSVYLTWIKFAHQESRCIVGLGDCFSVNTSRYSTFYGVPVAVFGMIGYLAILALLLLESRKGFWEANAVLAEFGVALFGVLFSAYLTFLEIVVIHAICPYCVLSAFSMLVIFALSIVRLALPGREAQPNSKAGG